MWIFWFNRIKIHFENAVFCFINYFYSIVSTFSLLVWFWFRLIIKRSNETLTLFYALPFGVPGFPFEGARGSPVLDARGKKMLLPWSKYRNYGSLFCKIVICNSQNPRIVMNRTDIKFRLIFCRKYFKGLNNKKNNCLR